MHKFMHTPIHVRAHERVIVIGVIHHLQDTQQSHVCLLTSPALSSISHVAGPPAHQLHPRGLGVLPGAPMSASPWPRHSFYT